MLETIDKFLQTNGEVVLVDIDTIQSKQEQPTEEEEKVAAVLDEDEKVEEAPEEEVK